jgi:hypothetical protein
MTALSTDPVLTRSRSTSSGMLLTRVGVAVTVLAIIVEGGVLGFGTTTAGTAHYKYAADYWLTAAVFPHVVGLVLVLLGVRRLQDARDGRRGRAGIALAVAGLLAVSTICAMSLAVGHEVQGGPTYIVGTLATVVGIALFAAGSWSADVLPRWALAIWPVVWAVGSFAAFNISPALLAVFYGVVLLHLRRRAER